jgi:hypothetical protein
MPRPRTPSEARQSARPRLPVVSAAAVEGGLPGKLRKTRPLEDLPVNLDQSRTRPLAFGRCEPRLECGRRGHICARRRQDGRIERGNGRGGVLGGGNQGDGRARRQGRGGTPAAEGASVSCEGRSLVGLEGDLLLSAVHRHLDLSS